MLDSNMFAVGAMYHVPAVNSAENTHVYAEEHVKRHQDFTNTIIHEYEYSQPYSIMTSANGFSTQITNPFGTPAQVAVLYASVLGINDYFALGFDTQLQTNFLPATRDFTPCWFQQGVSTFSGAFYWINFKEYVSLVVNESANNLGINIILGFRRKVEQIIPKNDIPFNSLDQ